MTALLQTSLLVKINYLALTVPEVKSRLTIFFFHRKRLRMYSEVPNRRADRNKRAGLEKSGALLAYLLSKLINEQGGIFHFTK